MQHSEDGGVCQNLSEADPRRELLDRVASNRLFSNSPALKAFLLYIGEQAIAGRLDAIKEQQIGSRVFGRKPDYDPAEDNIVRVRARQLRQRLNDYFAGDGRNESVVMSIPKGHYIPVFGPRDPRSHPESGPDELDPLIPGASICQTGLSLESGANGPGVSDAVDVVLRGDATVPALTDPAKRPARSQKSLRLYVLSSALILLFAAGIAGVLLGSKQNAKARLDPPAPVVYGRSSFLRAARILQSLQQMPVSRCGKISAAAISTSAIILAVIGMTRKKRAMSRCVRSPSGDSPVPRISISLCVLCSLRIPTTPLAPKRGSPAMSTFPS
jgi:hypothetical protein